MIVVDVITPWLEELLHESKFDIQILRESQKPGLGRKPPGRQT